MINVIKRNGNVVPFEISKIKNAIQRAFDSCDYKVTQETIDDIASEVDAWEDITVEEIQDQIEEILMDYGMKIAKQCREKGVNHIVYIQSSPCMSEPFIKRLWYAQQYYKEMYGEQLGLTYVTKLTIVKNPEKHPELFV